MRFSIITANYNGASFLEETLASILSQRQPGIEVECIVVDGGSTDGSHTIIQRFRDEIDHLIIEKDSGPANAINKGLALAGGEFIAWLNADDIYAPDALKRVAQCLEESSGEVAFCFGRCPIIDADGQEIRHGITRFKELFFPFSSRFVHQSINYISQPALFFRRSAFARAGYLREDLVAAWDYEFILRLWRQGRGVCIAGAPLAAFRWHAGSISGRNFSRQFKEEFEAARDDAGLFSPQTLFHYGVRWGIVAAYSAMTGVRKLQSRGREDDR